MKSVSKNKFLTCFRPVDFDTMLDESEDVNITYPSTNRRKHETQNPASSLIQNQAVDHPPKQTLAKVIKAMVFQTILNTRAHKKKRYSQNCFGSKRNYSLHTRTSSSSSFKTNIEEIKGIESALSSSSSSPCSPCLSDSSICKKIKHTGDYLHETQR
ncbi:hypothetical protein RYX36_010527 [Vicia faba]